MGDPEFFGGFIFIPVDEFTDLGGEEPFAPPAIAAIRADTLEYVGHAPLPADTSTAWCAIDAQGTVYASHATDGAVVNRFRIVWTDSGTLTFSTVPPLLLSVAPQDIQGGVVSPSGELLYICAGSLYDTLPSHGISVFDISNGKRIKHSTNMSGPFNTEGFNYGYSSGFPVYDEPEGLTIWDLDGGQAPGIRGQLHVLLLNNDDPDPDNVTLKHYTHTIWVDLAYSDVEDGNLETPFNTVAEALNFAWEGTRISIKGGSYPEPHHHVKACPDDRQAGDVPSSDSRRGEILSTTFSPSDRVLRVKTGCFVFFTVGEQRVDRSRFFVHFI